MEKKDLKQIKNVVESVVGNEIKKSEKRTDKKIESLAQMVAGGFEQVDRRFEQVDRRFEQVDKRFDSLEAQIIDLKEEVRQIRVELKQIWNKLEEIEQRLEKLFRTAKEDADAIASDVINLRQRVEFLESQIKEMQTA